MSPVPDLSDANPVAVALAWLQDHPVTAATLGGPGHVTGLTEAPWPHLRVHGGPNGSIRDSRGSAEYEVELELVGDPTGAPGQAVLWQAGMRLLDALCDLPEQQTTGPGVPVVSRVRPNGVLAWAPMTNGQPRYIIGVTIVIRPPAT